MKIVKYLKKAMVMLTAVSVFAMPLIACGNDNKDNNGSVGGIGVGGKLRGERVTEQQWKDGIDALMECENYTEIIDYVDYYEHSDIIIKYDLQNGIIYISAPFESGEQHISYFVLYNNHRFLIDNIKEISEGEYVVDEENFYLHKWYITSYDNIYDIKSSVGYYMLGMCLEDIFDYGYRDEETNQYVHNYDAESIYYKYSDAVFNTMEGSYRCNNAWLGLRYADFYFSNGYIYAVQTEDSGGADDMKAVCKDFGTTVIDVPTDVSAIIEEIKATF